MKRRAVWVALATVALAVVPAAGQGGIDCERCHGELELLRQYVPSLNEARSMTVSEDMLHGSAHAELTCVECHAGFTRFPHAETATTESCVACHEDQDAAWQTGLHSGLGEAEPVLCADCHGVHDTAPADSLEDGDAMRAMTASCVGCHETQRLPADAHHRDHNGCYVCHDPHGVRSPDDPESWMAPEHQPRVCGACHDSVATIFTEGIHARVLSGEEETDLETGPPSCTSCHGAHPVAGKGDRGFSTAAVERCAECHEKAADTFFGTYHGKAHALGSAVAATCADCHGAHGIEPAAVPASRVHASNLVETCGSCHEHARPAFVRYDSHPDPMDRERNPALFYSFWFMNTLLIGTLTVFGLHTLLWWVRATIDRRRGVTHHGGGGGE
jgi:hypothetical protein